MHSFYYKFENCDIEICISMMSKFLKKVKNKDKKQIDIFIHNF